MLPRLQVAASGAATRKLPDWTPTGSSLVADLATVQLDDETLHAMYR